MGIRIPVTNFSPIPNGWEVFSSNAVSETWVIRNTIGYSSGIGLTVKFGITIPAGWAYDGRLNFELGRFSIIKL